MQIAEIKPRRLNLKDAKEIYEALSPEIFLYLKSSPPKSLEEEKMYLKKLINEMNKGKSYYYVYREKNAGVAGFGGIKTKGHFAELSLWVRKSLWGKGIGRAILNHLQKICSKINKSPIIACYKHNDRAIKLYLDVGFTKLKNREQIVKIFGRYEPGLVYFLFNFNQQSFNHAFII
ncbi:MAG: GNAT family N-acetyltransferase [Candidatus Anstonellales archaeon]